MALSSLPVTQELPRTGWDGGYDTRTIAWGRHSNARSPMLRIDRSLLHVLWLIVSHQMLQCQVVLSRSHWKHFRNYHLPFLVPSHPFQLYYERVGRHAVSFVVFPPLSGPHECK